MSNLISKLLNHCTLSLNKLFSLDKKIHIFVITISSVLIVSFTFQSSVLSDDKITAQTVYQNEKEIGYIPVDVSKDTLLNKMETAIENENDVPVEVSDVVLVEESVEKSLVTPVDEFVNNTTDIIDYNPIVKKLYINDEYIGIVSSDNTFESVFNKISNKYKTADTTEVSSLDKIVLEDYVLQDEKVLSEEELNTILDRDVEGEMTYTVEENDSLWSISNDEDVPLDDLYEMNDLTEDSILSISQEVIISNAVPFMDVETKEVVTYETEANPPIEYIENSNEYKSYKKVIEEGSVGSKVVTEEITKINGMEENVDILNEDIIVEPTTKVIEIGTSEIPPKKAVGSFINPSTTGRLSDYYMARNGKHAGIDIALPYGNNVLASDGGVVSYSGWMNGYGNLVIIDHENGYETYYGHNSSLSVSKGERVYQGQVIAKVGSTGRSSGNHIHFEVRKNGSTKNPLAYIKGY